MQNQISSMPYEILPEAPLYDWKTIWPRFMSDDPVSVRDILPYKKTLMKLNDVQLKAVLREACIRKWKVLDLSNCWIHTLPAYEIGQLKDLEILILGSEHDHPQYVNSFNELPDTIANMSNLKILAINNAPLTELTDSLSQLTQLQFLDIRGNKCFSVFPEVIYELVNLRVLRISYSTSVKKKVKPYVISKELNQLQMLQKLFITGDGFVALPDEIADLPHLECLFISRTHIKSLPESISNLRMLKELILYENSISSLPDGIGSINSLTSLKLLNEPIGFIPNSMTALSNLTEFIVEDTPLNRKIPPSIQRQSPRSMIKFLLNIQSDEIKTAPPNESKMLVVGQGGVGKTSLINRLVHNSYTEDPSTEGIDIKEWPISDETVDSDRKKVLRIWDFGGQEIYHATHQFFLSERSLYVLVWDARQDIEYGRVEYWLNAINLYAKDSPIFMVVNKYDGITPEPRIDIEKYRERFPNLELPLYKISCRDNRYIDELKEHLRKRANLLPLMNQPWPERWIAVRGFLLELYRLEGKHYIKYSEYLEICEHNNVDEDEAESLIKCLHDLGIVLCFRNDGKLKNWVILEKEWGTKAVYQVLNFGEHRNGIVGYDALEIIWADKKVYPVNMHPILRQLMFRFQISFEINGRNQLLIAELLNFSSIEPPEDFSEKAALNFRCQYSFLPPGIMSRFIVASHEYLLETKSDGSKLCWLKGAYLANGKGSMAKIELFDDIDERYIDIKVWDTEKKRAAEFFNEIRLIIMDINSSIPHVRYTELLRCNCEPECSHFYKFDTLSLYRDKNRDIVVCDRTISEVDVRQLLDDFGL